MRATYALPRHATCRARHAHRSTIIGEDTLGYREYMFDCLDADRQRYTVIHSDLLQAVCELAELLDCDLSYS